MAEGTTNPKCPKCSNIQVSKAGYAIRKGGRVQSYKCTRCGHTFIEKKPCKMGVESISVSIKKKQKSLTEQAVKYWPKNQWH